MAAFLASLAATANSRVDAQVTVYRYQNGGYYNPYGQGPYGGYNRGYAATARANSSMFPSRGGMFGGRTYGFSPNRNVPRRVESNRPAGMNSVTSIRTQSKREAIEGRLPTTVGGL